MQTLRLNDRRGFAPDEPDTPRYEAYSGADPFLGKRDPLPRRFCDTIRYGPRTKGNQGS